MFKFKTIKANFLFALLLMILPCFAFGEEFLVTRELNTSASSAKNISVTDELDLDHHAGTANSLLVVAKAESETGILEVLVNGLSVATHEVGKKLESFQFELGRILGADIETVEVRSHGNIEVAMVGMSIETEKESPVANVQFLSQEQVQQLRRNLQRANYDSEKVKIIKDSVASLHAKFSMEDSAKIIESLDFDSGKLEALQALKPSIAVRAEKVDVLLDLFSFDPDRDEAHELLLN